MRYYLAQTIGTGADAEGKQFRPAIAEHTNTWTVVDGFGVMLVRCAPLAAFDSDPLIQRLSTTLVAEVAPLDGEPDDPDSPELALKMARRFLLRQYLGSDDFTGPLNAKLSGLVRRASVRERLWLARGFDLDTLPGSTDLGDVLRAVLPRFKVRLEPRAMSPGGTFTDNFTEAGANVDLAAHTPSGGTAWTRIDGSANMAECRTANNTLIHNTGDGDGALYQCDDQGSVDHYVQYKVGTVGSSQGFVTNRATTRNAWVGIRMQDGSGVQIFKKTAAGTFTQLGSNGSTAVTNDTIRLESSGDSHEGFLNAVSTVGPTTDSFNNTETRQGVNPRSAGTFSWLDDFEAGTLAGGDESAALSGSAFSGLQTTPAVSTTVAL